MLDKYYLKVDNNIEYYRCINDDSKRTNIPYLKSDIEKQRTV